LRRPDAAEPKPPAVGRLPGPHAGRCLGLRDLRVNINRPNFLINPSNCDQKRVSATVTSTQGSVAHPSDRFQVGGCEKLKLTPPMRCQEPTDRLASSARGS
jgi:hypothetical protein